MFVLFIFLVKISQIFAQDCSFPIGKSNAPYILKENYHFPKSFNFKHDELFYVSCPKGTSSPYLVEGGDNVACKGGTNILNIRTVEIFDFNDIFCKSTPETSIRKLDEKCEKNGTIMEIGLEVYHEFVPAISCCFDEDKLAPFYCHYDLSSEEEAFKKTLRSSYEDFICKNAPEDCSFFDSGNVYFDMNLDGAYLNQEEIFDNLGITVPEKYLKLPLVATAFVQEQLQAIQTYPHRDYINVVPIKNSTFSDWRTVYAATIESTELGSTFSGTLHTAVAEKEDGEVVELYLGEGKVPVPEWIWFVSDLFGDNGLILVYNGFGDVDLQVSEVCDVKNAVSKNALFCPFRSVINSDLKQLIENRLCPVMTC